MFSIRGFAATDAAAPLAPFTFERRDPGPRDVRIEILYCGICHTDLHLARNDWGVSFYPMVPGHEIVGRVSEVGSGVQKLQVGDFAGVGCMVDSCRHCAPCRRSLEQFCVETMTLTYNSLERGKQTRTMGGYSEQIVVDEHFVVKVPAGLDLKGVAPLLCAGITTYSPLKLAKIGTGQKVGVIGLGGLGHIGVKFAKAFGVHVVMITTSPEKGADAMRLGADEVLVSTDLDAMTKHAGSFEFLLNTIPVPHDVNPYISLLGIDGTMSIVGAPGPLPAVAAIGLLRGRRSLTGSLIGGMAETQEMIDFCAEKGIVSDVETIAIQDVNSAYQRLAKNDVRYRFVIDMATLGTA
jgi:alcohol dehydrogenase (NADP+)